MGFLDCLFSPNPSKRSTEKFLVLWTVIWISMFAYIVVTKWYEEWTDLGYMVTGLLLSIPNFVLPNIFASAEDKKLPFWSRFCNKSYVWIALFNFIGNYFWSHYFFTCLGASYSFPITITLNKIPVALFLITQSYFQTYFVFSNIMIRLFGKNFLFKASVVLLTSWFLAFMETWTIESVPYYSFVDRDQMYKYGTVFYAIYFIPSFPMFFSMDEKKGENWTLWAAIQSSAAAGMIAFIFLDFWRLTIGSLTGSEPGVPFVNA
eukprot:TRINITY_DN6142_c0_g1_i1.p1 TRINITY_DN6142_c0_g1~~TRINITY_DN6142_c0_g1_i1.p1  ORF type:complete len:262 (+),score=53.48 TRINITY_DN6142_c0_g1_i1:84-869(+)